jgi:hypothetical protein
MKKTVKIELNQSITSKLNIINLHYTLYIGSKVTY